MKTFSQFISEAKPSKPDALKTIRKKWENRPGHKGLNVYASEKSDEKGNKHVKVHDLFVPPSLRGRGTGGRIMKGLTKYADKQKASMSLSQAPERGYKKKLDTFYRGHGFVKNSGRNKDYSVSDTHLRPAKKST